MLSLALIVLLCGSIPAAFAQCGCSPQYKLTWADMANNHVFEGDMILTPNQKLEYMGYRLAQSNTWPQQTLIWDIDPALRSKKYLVEAALKKISSATGCIKFKRRTNERGYVYVSTGAGCSSYVGSIGRQQKLSLDSGCWGEATIIHEFMHALGFHHEQGRPDRDKYITIHWSRIQSRYCFAFAKHPTANTFGSQYDTRSVMHYRASSFPCTSRGITITDKNGGTQLGNNQGMSQNDIYRLKRAYKCY